MMVVVVSAHDDGALRAFEADVLDYLLKPVRLDRLEACVQRIRTRAKASGPVAEEPLDRLAVKRKGGYVVVDIDDVVYFHVKDELVWGGDGGRPVCTRSHTVGGVTVGCPTKNSSARIAVAWFAFPRLKLIEPSGTGTYDLVLDHPEEPRLPLARERIASACAKRIPFAG